MVMKITRQTQITVSVTESDGYGTEREYTAVRSREAKEPAVVIVEGDDEDGLVFGAEALDGLIQFFTAARTLITEPEEPTKKASAYDPKW